MRSVYIFTGAPDASLIEWLDAMASRAPNVKQWMYPSSSRKVLYIEFADDLYDELESAVVQSLLDRFGGERARCICVDVSRNFPGNDEVEEFVVAVLRRFGGVAMDDMDDHCWTADEIEGQKTHQGRRFFCDAGSGKTTSHQ